MVEAARYLPQDEQLFKVRNTARTRIIEYPRPPIHDAKIFYLDNYRQRKKEEVKEKKHTENSTLADYISHFDYNWLKEKLPKDWYNLRGKKSEVGFIMKLQLALIKDLNSSGDMSDWVQKTEKDLLGFKLEYLSNHLVYPTKYFRDPIDPNRLEDRSYGKSERSRNSYSDMEEIVSENERNGSVKRSIMAMKKFFLSERYS